MLEGLKELFESKEKKKARKQLKEDIKNGELQIVEHKGKKYACGKESTYANTFTIYPFQKNGKPDPDQYLRISAEGVYNEGTLTWGSYGAPFESSDVYIPLNNKSGIDAIKNDSANGKIGINISVENKAFSGIKDKHNKIRYCLEKGEEITDVSSVLIEAFKNNEFGVSNEIFDIIVKAYPQTSLSEVYGQYKQECRGEELRARIGESQLRLEKKKNKQKTQTKEPLFDDVTKRNIAEYAVSLGLATAIVTPVANTIWNEFYTKSITPKEQSSQQTQNEAMFKACMDKDLKAFKQAIKDGADIKMLNIKNENVLTLAVGRITKGGSPAFHDYQLDIPEYILSNEDLLSQLNLDNTNSSGHTALQILKREIDRYAPKQKPTKEQINLLHKLEKATEKYHQDLTQGKTKAADGTSYAFYQQMGQSR